MKNLFTFLLFIIISTPIFAQVKITCDDVQLAIKHLPEITYKEAIEIRVEDNIEACEYDLRNDKIVGTRIHPFVEAVHNSYADHRPLTISPDMIWLLICQGFSKHIDYNSELLRDKFVDFEGKKKIVIATELLDRNFIKGSDKTPWKLAFPAFADSIKKHVGPELHDLYIQNFTTTTFMETAAYEVTLMDGMDSYFEYKMTTSCGIPTITLEGTPADWLKIKTDLQKFKGYEIDNWITALEPIIDQFVEASNNNIDQKFWGNIYKRRGGSGGPYITGWVIKFFPYLKTASKKSKLNPYIDAEPQGGFQGLNTSDFYTGLSKAKFVWDYHGKEYKMEFLAGFIGIRQDKKTMNLTPEIGWAVKEQQKKKRKKKK